jgi:hypothetical protein
MEKNNESVIKESLIIFYQIETILKNQNSILTERISDGDLISSNIAFSNALLINTIRKFIKSYKILEDYSKSEEFSESIKTLLDGLSQKKEMN